MTTGRLGHTLPFDCDGDRRQIAGLPSESNIAFVSMGPWFALDVGRLPSAFDVQAGATPTDLRGLAVWLVAQEAEEVVMKSTAQYRRPVWEALEQHWRPE